MGSSSMVTKNDKRSYVDIIREFVKKEDCETLKEDMYKLEMNKNKEDDHAWKQSSITHNNDLRRYAPTRRPPIPRYQNFFFGLCYSCNNYVHKAIYCRDYTQNRNTWRRNIYEKSKYQFESNYVRNPCGAFDRNYNRFGALSYEIECYKCNNFGHTTIN